MVAGAISGWAGESLYNVKENKIAYRPAKDLEIRSLTNVGPIVSEWRNSDREILLALYLNARSMLISADLISMGTVSMSIAHPREIFAPAIEYRASGIILAHNHPSGNLRPSQDDWLITRRMIGVGRMVGIPVLEHVIFTEHDLFSMLFEDPSVFSEGGTDD